MSRILFGKDEPQAPAPTPGTFVKYSDRFLGVLFVQDRIWQVAWSGRTVTDYVPEHHKRFIGIVTIKD